MRPHLIAMLALLAAPASPALAAKDGKDPGARIVCKTMGDTSSRTRTNRVCKTRAEWEMEEQKAQAGLSDLQRRDGGYGQNRGGPGLPGLGENTDQGATPR